MNAWVIALIVCTVFVVLFGSGALWIFSVKTSLARKQEEVEKSFLKMNQQMKKRYDMVAKLIQICQSVNANDIAEKVIQARYSCLSSDSISEQEKNEPFLVSSLKNLFLNAKNTKKLNKNSDFEDIFQQLEEIDVDILDAKRTYNANVQALNHVVESPFTRTIARKLNYKKAETFKIDLIK